MIQAFYTGVSGLRTYSGGIDVTADNLANVSTTGFRAYNAEYANLFESTLASASVGLSDSVGVGVRMQETSMSTALGAMELSERNTDIAILGDGWFGVERAGERMFTRAGDFVFDANEDLVTQQGYHVLGTMGGNISQDNVLTQALDTVALGDVDAQQNLRFPTTLTYPPEPTTKAEFKGNIGVGAEGDEIVGMGATVIDPQNNRNNLHLTFTKSETQTPPGTQWDVVGTISSTTQFDADGNPVVYDEQNGVVSFDETGALVSSTLGALNNNGQSVTVNLGEGFSGIVSFDTPVTPASVTTDGNVGGELEGYTISQDGDVIASFSNGRQSSVGKIAIYHFQNDQGLERVGDVNFIQSSNSGKAFFVKDADGKNVIGTTLANYRLETSNVDMNESLTSLIILQRAYDANSKSVTTADQMIQKALNMDAR